MNESAYVSLSDISIILSHHGISLDSTVGKTGGSSFPALEAIVEIFMGGRDSAGH